MVQRLRFAAGAGTVLVLFATACAPPPEEPAKTENTIPAPVLNSNERMAERLKQIADHVTFQNTGYRNDKRVEIMGRQIAEADQPPGVQAEVRLAVELLRSGRPEEAIEHVDRATEKLKSDEPNYTPNNRRTLARLKAIAYLSLGERENCLLDHNVDSCILPISGQGVHRKQRGSRGAIPIYEHLLEQYPDDLSFRWLLNIAYMTIGEWPEALANPQLIPPEVFESEHEIGRFFDVASHAGVDHIALSGGSIMEDFNGDGHLDLVTSSWGVADQMRYFESNRDGTFADRTKEAGLIGQIGGLNMVHADYDNDGHPDVLVLRGAWLGDNGMHPNSLLRNRGDGTFEDVTERAGILRFQPTHSAAWGDYDNDGWLDLFVANESRDIRRPCELFRNNGDGTFTDVAPEVGLDHVGFVKGAVWGDYDNDGRLDLFLSQMGEPNVLYRNESDGSFTDVTAQAGVAEPLLSFPTWFFDYDNDGWLDLMVATFADFGGTALSSVVADYLDLPTVNSRCKLYRNRGDGTFEDVSARTATGWVLLAMGANFGDIDNDGWLDMYFGTGEPALYTLVPNVMLRNDHGRAFQDVTTAGGFGNMQKGHGIAFGDIDNDGDQDIYANMGGAYSGDVYQNVLLENPGHGNHWITLRFRGVRSNRLAIGARVHVLVEDEDGASRHIHRVVGTGGSFGSSSLQLEIGLGRARHIARLEVRWPATGELSIFENVPLDRVFQVSEDSPELEPVDTVPIPLGP